jgi:YVTN family beta-propeller protein
VRDILVSLDGKTPKNYPSGDFQIERAIPGPFQLKAEREEYLPAIFNGTLDNWGNADPVEMWMRPIPRVVGTIEDPVKQFGAPVDICFSGDGARAYVVDELGSISVINVVTDTVVDQIEAGDSPMGVIAHPLDDEVYMADAEAHQVLVLNVQSREIVSRIDVDRYPQQLAISQDGSQLYVTCRDSGSVVIIDTGRRQVELSFFVGREPHGIALSHDGMTLYVANSGDNSVSVMDAFTGRSLEVISVASYPQHLAVSEDYVYVSNSLGDRVSVIDQTSQRLVEHTEMGNGILLGDLAVLQESRGGDVVYVIDQTNSVLRLIDSVTLEAIEDNIPVGGMPTAVATSPDLTKIYVVNGGSGNISVLEF